MNKIILIIILLLFKFNSYSNLLQDDTGYGLYPAPENDHILIGLNYMFNFNKDYTINSKIENYIFDNYTVNAEIEFLYISYKNNLIMIYLGYEYFRDFNKIEIQNMTSQFESNISNDFILIKLSILDYLEIKYSKNYTLYYDIQTELGIGYMPFSKYSFQNDDDFRVLKENNLIENRKSYYPINYKLGFELNFGIIPQIKIFNNNIFLNTAYKIEYYHQPIITKNWNFVIELGLKYNIEFDD